MSHVEKFDREEGLDQESAASWRKRWEAEQRDKAEAEAAKLREVDKLRALLRCLVVDVDAMRDCFPPSWEKMGEEGEDDHWFGGFERACVDAWSERVRIQWPNLSLLIAEAKQHLQGKEATNEERTTE